MTDLSMGHDVHIATDTTERVMLGYLLSGVAPPILAAGRWREGAVVSTESEVRALLDSRSDAIRAKDLDRLMSFYSPDVVYFDIVPPLQYVGSTALRGRFTHWFDGFEGPIGQEIHDLTILANGDVAVASMLIRASGVLKTGRDVGLWVRATSSCRRSNNSWSITHEHISLPVDLESGTAATDLVA